MSIASFFTNLLSKIKARFKWGGRVFHHVKGKVNLPPPKGGDTWREFNSKVEELPGESPVMPHDPKDQPKESPCGGEVINGPIARHELDGVTVLQVETKLPDVPPAAYSPTAKIEVKEEEEDQK